MRTSRLIAYAGLALVTLVAAGSSCPTEPKIKTRFVDLAVGQSVTLDFPATGSTNTFTSGNVAVRLDQSINLPQAIAAAGIDVSSLKSITLAGVSYRVSVADPTSGRTVTSGSVQVAVNSNPMVDLIDNFSGAADKVTGWITPSLDSLGVDQINALLASELPQIQNDQNPPETLTYNVSGVSTPTDVATSFTYELRLTLSIVGTVKTKVLS
ncbi:MAG TPA: hypothetical protein VMH61_06800 [Candidatus Acidoferrales bacterium]|nr:hypothetical protein [Candidatus Acidoferrales bacterium]